MWQFSLISTRFKNCVIIDVTRSDNLPSIHHPFSYLPIYLSIYLFIHHLFIYHLSTYSSISLPYNYISICSSIPSSIFPPRILTYIKSSMSLPSIHHPSINLPSIHPSIHLPIYHLSTHPSIYQSTIYPPIHQSIYHLSTLPLTTHPPTHLCYLSEKKTRENQMHSWTYCT